MCEWDADEATSWMPNDKKGNLGKSIQAVLSPFYSEVRRFKIISAHDAIGARGF
jgi:hypothetical protein